HRLGLLASKLACGDNELHEVRASHSSHVEIGIRRFRKRRRRKRAKLLAQLDALVDDVAHLRRTGISKDAAVAERAGAEFHAATKPADNLTLRERLSDGLFHLLLAAKRDLAAAGVQSLDNRLLAVARAKTHAPQPLAGRRLPQHLMLHILSGADAGAVVAGGGKHISTFEDARAGELAGHHDVEGRAPGKANILAAIACLEMI